MTTPKVGGATPKVGGVTPTPKVAGTTPKIAGMTPGTFASFAYSPAVNSSSPATLAAQLRHRGSPAVFPLTFTPNSAATAEVIAQLGNFGTGSAGRTPAYLQGFHGSSIPLPPDENKKRELEEILRTLALKPGRISIEGIARLAKRLGLDVWEDKNEVGPLSLSGSNIVVDIDFNGPIITQVALSFANTLGSANDLAALAAAILRRNLQPKKPLFISDLSDFANNLERLSKLDKLGATHNINCFTAISGLYESLKRIFEYEKGVMEGGELETLCKGNGRPKMHARGKVGLSVEYWKLRRRMGNFTFKETGGDVTMGEGDQNLEDEESEGDEEHTWRVIIEIDEIGPECMSLEQVRTSENWVGEAIVKPSEDSMFGDDEFVIDWLEPELSVENLMDVESNARFIARLDPPIVVPLVDEVTIFTGLGLYSPPGQIGATTLDGLLFPRQMTPDLGPLTAVRRVFLPPAMGGQEGGNGAQGQAEGKPEGGLEIPTVVHKYTLHALKPVYAREVWEIPFSHPRQLGPILQIFRQYVLIATLLRSCLKAYNSTLTSTASSNTSPTSKSQPNHSHPVATATSPPPDDIDLDLDSFLSSPAPSTNSLTAPPNNAVPIDISLTSDPLALNVIFPSAVVPGRLVDLEIEVGRNAHVVARYSIIDTPDHIALTGGQPGEKTVSEEVLTRAVETVEDVGVVVEWLRRRV